MLELFILINAVDPIFFDLSLNLDRFEKQIVRLERIRAAEPFDVLVPSLFLEDFIEVQRANNNFLTSLSYDSALELVSKQKEAALTYHQAISELQAAYEEIFSGSATELKETPIVFINSYTTGSVVEDDLNLIYQNSLKLIEEVSRRESCLKKHKGCEELLQAAWMRRDRFSESSEVRVTDSFLKNYNEMIIPYSELDLNLNEKVIGVYSLRNGCWGWTEAGTPPERFFYLILRPSGIFEVRLADASYYLDLRSETYGDYLYELFRSNGYRFYHQPDSNIYICNDMTYYIKLGKLSGLDGFSSAIERIIRDLDLFLNERRNNINALSDIDIFISRNSYSIFYMSENPAVWRLENKPQYLVVGKNWPVKNYYTYWEIANEYPFLYFYNPYHIHGRVARRRVEDNSVPAQIQKLIEWSGKLKIWHYFDLGLK